MVACQHCAIHAPALAQSERQISELSKGSAGLLSVGQVYPIIAHAVRLRHNCPYSDVRWMIKEFLRKYEELPYIVHVIKRLVPSFYVPLSEILSYKTLDEESLQILQHHYVKTGRVGYVLLLYERQNILGLLSLFASHGTVIATASSSASPAC